MVYRVQATLRFATTAARTTARTTVNSSASDRGMPPATDVAIPSAPIGFVYDATSGSAIDAQMVYTSIQGLASPQAGSMASWHACYHGDLVQLCAVTGSKVW